MQVPPPPQLCRRLRCEKYGHPELSTLTSSSLPCLLPLQKNKCINCLPLQPYDPTVLQGATPPIKFLSFHSFLRRLRTGADNGRSVLLLLHPLEPICPRFLSPPPFSSCLLRQYQSALGKVGSGATVI